MRRWISRVLIAGLIVFAAIQLIPYGRDHSNPPVEAEPNWDSPATRELAVLACYDCHSNETAWPWYSNVAPISWAIQRDVNEGRDKLNFSEWTNPDNADEADEAAETVRDRSMPTRQYLIMHPEARLTDEQLAELATGLATTFGDKEASDSRDDDDDSVD